MDERGASPAGSDTPIDWIADAVVLTADSRWDTSVRAISVAGGTELARQRFAFTGVARRDRRRAGRRRSPSPGTPSAGVLLLARRRVGDRARPGGWSASGVRGGRVEAGAARGRCRRHRPRDRDRDRSPRRPVRRCRCALGEHAATIGGRCPPPDRLDPLGRPLHDLRISVTDRCNFRCTYCMPKEVYGVDHAFLPRSEILDFEEIDAWCGRPCRSASARSA